MRRNLRYWGGILAATFGMAFGWDVFSADTKNPYRVILARNPFNLRPIVVPPPVASPEPPPPPSPKVFLTGIMTSKALLQMEDPETRKTEFLPPLAAGERYKEITVVAVDALNHTVQIRNGQVDDTLDFLNDGIKPTAVAATPPIPTPTRHRIPPVAPPPPPPEVPRDRAPENKVIIGGGHAPDAVPPVNAAPAPPPTVPVMTRAELESRIALEREIRQRHNDPSYKLLPTIRQ
jgi:hypothetical protein